MNSNKSFEIKYSLVSTSGTPAVVGAYDGSVNGNAVAAWDGKMGSYTKGEVYFETMNTNIHIVKWNVNNGRVLYDDIDKGTCSPDNACSKTWGLFAANYNTGYTNFSSSRIYYMKIYDSNTLVRNFIPCYRKSDTVAGLYDTVNDVFYTNAGSGVFTVGLNVN